MASTFSTNTNLNLQATGDNSGTWGAVLNAQDFQIIDNVLGNVQTISLSASNFTLNTAQTQVATIKLTGVLTANVTVFFPAIGRVYFVQNACTGAFTVTLAITGTPGATALVPPNSLSGQLFVLDGTNVYADFGGTPPGKVDMFIMSAVPYGWLIMDGSAVSRASYPALNLLAAAAGYAAPWGAGNGSTTFNLPDARGYFPRAWDDGAGRDPGRVIGSTQTGQLQSHNHGINDPGHTHGFFTSGWSGAGSGLNVWSPGGGAVQAITLTSANSLVGNVVITSSVTGVSVQNTGGNETRPISLAFAFAIKW